jgi:hypothetical protein
VKGTGETFESDLVFHQEANGDITFLDDDDVLITLVRSGPGNGRVIPYKVTLSGQEDQCIIDGSVNVTIDTQTNTGRANIRLRSTNCHERQMSTSILTKK